MYLVLEEGGATVSQQKSIDDDDLLQAVADGDAQVFRFDSNAFRFQQLEVDAETEEVEEGEGENKETVEKTTFTRTWSQI